MERDPGAKRVCHLQALTSSLGVGFVFQYKGTYPSKRTVEIALFHTLVSGFCHLKESAKTRQRETKSQEISFGNYLRHKNPHLLARFLYMLEIVAPYELEAAVEPLRTVLVLSN